MYFKACNRMHVGDRQFCSTHNTEMTPSMYHCPVGKLELEVMQYLNTLESRIIALEQKLSQRLVDFGQTLEKLHDDPSANCTSGPTRRV